MIRNLFILFLCLLGSGCAHLQRPAIINERLSAEAEEVRQQAEALEAWQLCLTRYRDSWDPQYQSGCEVESSATLTLATLGAAHVCGPYPGHGYTGTANPDEKGMNLLNVTGSLPVIGGILGASQ